MYSFISSFTLVHFGTTNVPRDCLYSISFFSLFGFFQRGIAFRLLVLRAICIHFVIVPLVTPARAVTSDREIYSFVSILSWLFCFTSPGSFTTWYTLCAFRKCWKLFLEIHFLSSNTWISKQSLNLLALVITDIFSFVIPRSAAASCNGIKSACRSVIVRSPVTTT